MNLVRTQILLTKEQVRRLRRLAEERGISVSALVREMVEQGLSEQHRRKEELLQALKESARWVAEHAPDLVHTPEDLQAMREERDDELARNIFGVGEA